jgi:hypothetical protein
MMDYSNRRDGGTYEDGPCWPEDYYGETWLRTRWWPEPEPCPNPWPEEPFPTEPDLPDLWDTGPWTDPDPWDAGAWE